MSVPPELGTKWERPGDKSSVVAEDGCFATLSAVRDCQEWRADRARALRVPSAPVPAACLDPLLQLALEGDFVEPRHDRRQDLDADRAGTAQELAAGPVEAGVERDRDAGHAELGIDMRDAELIGRRGTGGTACALGEDQELPAVLAELDLGAARDLRQGASPGA